MTAQEYALSLHLISGLGPVRIKRLLEHFATPELILSAPAELLMQVQGIGSELATQITRWRKTTNAEAELALAEKSGARVITLFDEEYPCSLRTLYDPPLVLYCRGRWFEYDEKSIAIVGSRRATYYGLNHAKLFAQKLAGAGVSIISGLARGVDTAAHEGALSAGGRTIAVLGSGLNKLYPAENEVLAQRIAEGYGAVVTELPMNVNPSKSTFPLRNRLVSGWSRGVVVVEAPHRSGSLITARFAGEQGRRIFALPGNVDRPESAGCHELIRDGATLVSSPHQILEEFEWLPLGDDLMPSLFEFSATQASKLSLMDSQETIISQAIKAGHDTIDALCQHTDLSVRDITRLLTQLQIRRLVIPLVGGRFECC